MIKIFSSMNSQELEETVNNFLCNPRYRIEDIQYRPTIVNNSIFDTTIHRVMITYCTLDA